MPFSGVFKLIGKAFRSTTKRPLQRFNIYSKSKRYIGEESKHFFPAPRAIGPVSKIGASQYPHLEGGGFKSVRQRRIEAIESRRQRLLDLSNQQKPDDGVIQTSKAYSEIKQDDSLVIEASHKLPVIKTINKIPVPPPESLPGLVECDEDKKLARPLPTSTSLDLRDPECIWAVDKVPIGRLDLNKFQELMLNKLADDAYWTPKQISETYNIKEEYAENLITYLRQIRIVVSPRMAKILDYTQRTNLQYQATKHIVYIVDKSLRNSLDKSVDDTFLPEDQLDESIRELLDAGKLAEREKLAKIRRPVSLQIESKPLNQQIEAKKLNKPTETRD